MSRIRSFRYIRLRRPLNDRRAGSRVARFSGVYRGILGEAGFSHFCSFACGGHSMTVGSVAE
ncbi:MAG: hypothetical protein GXO76_09105 [Calditrichaeota bacterium]|nr:hypothetical protein [Calditrichota bacterium]